MINKGIAALVIFGVMVLLALAFLDTHWGQRHTTTATLIALKFRPAHTNTRTMMVGKVMIPQTDHVPDTYIAEFFVEERSFKEQKISKEEYTRLEEKRQTTNSVVCAVQYTQGYFTKGMNNIYINTRCEE